MESRGGRVRRRRRDAWLAERRTIRKLASVPFCFFWVFFLLSTRNPQHQTDVMECAYHNVEYPTKTVKKKIPLRILPQLLSLVPPTPHRSCGGAQDPDPVRAVGRRSALNSWTGMSASALLSPPSPFSLFSLSLCHMFKTQVALCNSCQRRRWTDADGVAGIIRGFVNSHLYFSLRPTTEMTLR